MPILLNKKLQGLLVAERVNYNFVKAITLTDEFNVYLFLFLPKNPSYKRKAGTA